MCVRPPSSPADGDVREIYVGPKLGRSVKKNNNTNQCFVGRVRSAPADRRYPHQRALHVVAGRCGLRGAEQQM